MPSLAMNAEERVRGCTVSMWQPMYSQSVPTRCGIAGFKGETVEVGIAEVVTVELVLVDVVVLVELLDKALVEVLVDVLEDILLKVLVEMLVDVLVDALLVLVDKLVGLADVLVEMLTDVLMRATVDELTEVLVGAAVDVLAEVLVGAAVEVLVGADDADVDVRLDDVVTTDVLVEMLDGEVVDVDIMELAVVVPFTDAKKAGMSKRSVSA